MPASVLGTSRRRPWSARPAKAVLWVLCGLMLGAALPAAAQDTTQPLRWQALGGPAGRVSHITVDDAGEAYAVSVARVQRKDDQTEWEVAGNQLSAYALYRSVDGGETFQPATNNLPPGPISSVYQDPVTDAVYAGLQGNGDSATRRFGLWRSRDHGASWDQVALGRDDLVIQSITRGARGEGLYLGALLATKYPTSYVYRSDDDGASWTAVEALHFEQAPGSVLDRLIADPQDPARLYITTQGGELYVSSDRGNSWSLPAAPPEALMPGRSYTTRLASAGDGQGTMLLARGGNGGTSLLIDRSSDDGVHWSRQLTSGLPGQASVSAFVGLQGGILLLNLNTGTYRSTDEGVTWQALEGPLSSGEVTSFALATMAPAPRVLAATAHGLFISRDSGALWQPAAAGLPANSMIAGLLTDSQHPELAYAISGDGGFLLRSTDKGRTWSPAAHALPPLEPLAWALDPANANTVYIGSYGRLYRSSDAGANWQVIPFDSAGVYAVSAIAVAPSDSKVIYAGGRPLQRSSDGGQSWQVTAVLREKETAQAEDVVGLVIDPGNSDHLWAALRDEGVFESNDGGSSWLAIGLADQPINWLAADNGSLLSRSPDTLTLYAGVSEDGIYRRTVRGAINTASRGDGWTTSTGGLPEHSTVISFAADGRTAGALWAGRDGGGVYWSTDGGASWNNAGAQVGNNLALSLAIDYSSPGGLLMGTANAGVWALRTLPGSQGLLPAVRGARPAGGVDGRIEVVWPHDWAPVTEARQANLGIRLFLPHSLVPPDCTWAPVVKVWQALDSGPAQPLGVASQRTVEGQPFPYWELNDVDVRAANDPQHKLYFMIQVSGIETAGTGIWAHAADPRTYFPQQDVPSGITAGTVDALDARIEIVWPHDEAGNARPVSEGSLANVAVELFAHGTRLSVPVGWEPAGLTLYGAWNQEIGQPLATQSVMQVRQSGAITYPIWEFQNIPVDAATNPANKLYLWVMVQGVATYPTIWTHGADARTFFPAQDEPIQGCTP